MEENELRQERLFDELSDELDGIYEQIYHIKEVIDNEEEMCDLSDDLIWLRKKMNRIINASME